MHFQKQPKDQKYLINLPEKKERPARRLCVGACITHMHIYALSKDKHEAMQS